MFKFLGVLSFDCLTIFEYESVDKLIIVLIVLIASLFFFTGSFSLSNIIPLSSSKIVFNFSICSFDFSFKNSEMFAISSSLVCPSFG